MQRHPADIDKLHNDIETLRRLIGANLERRRGNRLLQACLDLLRERLERLEQLERRSAA